MMIPYSVQFEEEWSALKDDADAQAKFAEETKCKTVLPKIIKAGYQELSLQSYFTAGACIALCVVDTAVYEPDGTFRVCCLILHLCARSRYLGVLHQVVLFISFFHGSFREFPRN